MKKLLMLLMAVTLVGCNIPSFDNTDTERPIDAQLDQMIEENSQNEEAEVDTEVDAEAEVETDTDADPVTETTPEPVVEAEPATEDPEAQAAVEAAAQAESDALENELQDQPIIIIE